MNATPKALFEDLIDMKTNKKSEIDYLEKIYFDCWIKI
jgi:hypothetical protein